MNWLRDYQLDAVKRMHNGCILNGGVGSGKSRTALYYYFHLNGGDQSYDGEYIPMVDSPMDLYIITTARKRDTAEWEEEMCPFLIGNKSKYNHNVVIDSWNNIHKYVDVHDAFFIFDEQRVVGNGEWVKSFLKITKTNQWILLSATPGDTWSDYIPVFLANGFYRNRTDFNEQHVIFKRFTKWPQIDRYVNVGRLIRLRDRVLVDMDFQRSTISHDENIEANFDILKYREIEKTRWNIFENKPIENASEYCYTLRKLVNSDESRERIILELFEKHPRIIIFYNFDYELEILKNMYFGEGVEVAEWNGHRHQPIPECNSWVYLVQYTAGAEGWNCIKTDTIIFYSQNYSYKIMKQSSGRIDRLNTPYRDLYFYHIKSKASIDIGIERALKSKKKFNEGKFVGNRYFEKRP